MKLAAIDIGSNAARLLLTEVTEYNEQPLFNKLNLVRVPLRLGFDVFEHKNISEPKALMVVHTMKAFKNLLDAYGIVHYKACATSAMRDASNAEEIIKRVKWETGITIEVISGDEEAMIVFENHIAETLDKDHSYLYIDVGGGSTECSFFSNGILVFKKSFNIGTIRLLKNWVQDAEWDEMKDTLKAITKGHKEVIAIGSGGNINKVFSISKKKDGKPLSLELLKDYYKEMGSVGLEERMRLYKFREDRADVIVPALQIYTSVMRWTGATEIYVPKIGLADGLIQHLYEEIKKK
jgi:exopolyphosphatase / guanosine-5'-triphosphate,3'-diphosphate pyrophosphatase